MASQSVESYRAGADVVSGDAAACKVTFKTGTGLSDSFDATAFELGM